ncbi:MAG: TIGR00341 family protein [Gallionella sp.]|nr:TIGR00341 family protein [Gallionella sp.]MDD5611932.1 TIGR00341 family protein [Gallionella sp.]
MDIEKTIIQESASKLKLALAYRFNLRPDQSDFTEIDEDIRGGVEIKGTNLWVLMLAIFIASIGLDVNSTAVIIGAMLISPLMGPIMGIGYGIGIDDTQLIKKALGNLLISILIALLTSTLYFLISPFSSAQSELLARTTPSLWDVLIALFGGLAGIIAITRKEKSNVIPGVAIATALMPPLCTAGYGIANGSLHMFFGAFYLFFINCVFIAFSTLLLISYINPPHIRFANEEKKRKVKRIIYIIVLTTVLPSIYLAYGLVTHEVFNSRANEFINKELTFDNSFIAKKVISPEAKSIDITLVGEKISDSQLKQISKNLSHYGLDKAKLVVNQNLIKELDEASLKKSLLADIVNTTKDKFDSKNKELDDLKNEVTQLRASQHLQSEALKEQKQISEEFFVQYPQITSISLAKTTEYQPNQDSKSSVLLVNALVKKALSREDQRKINAWLKVRTGADKVVVTFEKS